MNPLKTELLDWAGCPWVESVAERLHGTPVLVDTRMDADGVLRNYDDGMSVEELIEDYGLEEAKVRGVLEFAGRLPVRSAA